MPITSDLPEGSYPVPRLPTAARRTDVAARSAPARKVGRKPKWPNPYLPASRSKRIIAIGREARRTAPWSSPQRIGIVALLGDVFLDFCEATVPHASVVVDLIVVRGNVDLIVPSGVVVHTHDVVVRPGYLSVSDSRRARLGGPVYWIQGLVVGGTLTVRTPA